MKLTHLLFICVLTATTAQAADIKVLTAGAYKPVLVALQSEFEWRTGHKLTI